MTALASDRQTARIPLTHAALAVLVAAIWGTNFVVIAVGLHDFPPLLFAFLRFALVFFPAALFVRRPRVRWSALGAYGVLTGGGQFGLIYMAMRGDITPGLASLVIQSQVFFTIGLAVLTAHERVSATQWLSILLAATGLVLIAFNAGGEATAFGLSLVLVAGFSWACANMLVKAAPTAGMLGYVVWASLFALPPLLLWSLALEGTETAIHVITSASLGAWLALLWQSVGNTLFGFAVWSWLLAKHSAASITPTALLVPIFGILTSALIGGEALQTWKIAAALLVMGGLSLNFLVTWLTRSR